MNFPHHRLDEEAILINLSRRGIDEDKNLALNHRLEYRIRVRGTAQPYTYLWGSAGITAPPATYPSPLVLHIANDKHGEAVTLYIPTVTAVQPLKPLGALGPGEHYSLAITQGCLGVYATCLFESTVYCVLSDH